MNDDHLKQPQIFSLSDQGRQVVEQAVWLYLKHPKVSLIDLGWCWKPNAKFNQSAQLYVRIHGFIEPDTTDSAGDRPSGLGKINAQLSGFPIAIIRARYVLNHHRRFRAHGMGSPSFIQEAATGQPLEGQRPLLAGWVQDLNTSEFLLLSNWHVLNQISNIECIDIPPMVSNGSSQTNLRGQITIVRHAMAANLDAAIARISWCEGVRPEYDLQSDPNEVLSPQLGMRLMKCAPGKQTTIGIVTGVMGYTIQRFDDKKWIIGPIIHITAESSHQALCANGDSGALWVEQTTSRPVAMHFAGSIDGQMALALPLPEVLQELGVKWIAKWSQISDQSAPTPTDSIPVMNRPSENSGAIPTMVPAMNEPQRDSIAVNDPQTKATATSCPNQAPAVCNMVNRLDELIAWNAAKRLLFAWRIKQLWVRAALRHWFNSQRIKLVLIVALVICFVIALGLTTHQPAIEHTPWLDRISTEMTQATAIARVDQQRQYTMNKITTIINFYNPKMTEVLKRQIAREIYEMTMKYSNLDLELICATITHETGLTWDPRAVSPVNAMGLMQIMPATGIVLAKEEGLEIDRIERWLFDPIINIRLGCRYLSQLIEAYHLDGGLAAYNGGMRRAELWLRNGRAKGILHHETDRYVPSILKIYQVYQNM